MDAASDLDRRPESSSQPESRYPKTPVKKTRFADFPESDTPRSIRATPSSCTSACSNLSSLAATPLSEKMAKMADRCVALLDEYFAEQPPEPLSPTPYREIGDDSDSLSVDSTSTLRADDHSAKTFPRYLYLPTEVQDKILEEVLAVSHSQGLHTQAQPPALAVAEVSKKTREQVIRIMKKNDGHSVGLTGDEGTPRRKDAVPKSLVE